MGRCQNRGVWLLAVPAVLAALSIGWSLWLWRRGFPDRLRATSSDAFDCQLPAGVVTHRMIACAHAQRGWEVESVRPGAIRLRAGTTLFAWRKRIEISVRPTTDVTSTVSIVSSSPQVYDWGDNRRAVATITAALADARWG